jgi:hypothetical protein
VVLCGIGVDTQKGVRGIEREGVLTLWLNRLLAGRATRPGLWIGERLQQTQRTRTGNRFGAPLDLQLAKDFLVVPFHRFEGHNKPLAYLLI